PGMDADREVGRRAAKGDDVGLVDGDRLGRDIDDAGLALSREALLRVEAGTEHPVEAVARDLPAAHIVVQIPVYLVGIEGLEVEGDDLQRQQSVLLSQALPGLVVLDMMLHAAGWGIERNGRHRAALDGHAGISSWIGPQAS